MPCSTDTVCLTIKDYKTSLTINDVLLNRFYTFKVMVIDRGYFSLYSIPQTVFSNF